jgi:riboflavin kinase/FMN adenylyltransferase
MSIFHDIADLPNTDSKPLVLTIGMFDGIHLGHRQVIETARALADEKKTKLLCITFRNNPKTVLRPEQEILSIYPVEKKLELLKGYGVDMILLQSFTKELAAQTALEYLQNIYKIQCFSDLVLGYNATLGSDQNQNAEQVIAACKKLNVTVHYVSKVLIDEHPVSSSRIRKLITDGRIPEAERLLGRKYEK